MYRYALISVQQVHMCRCQRPRRAKPFMELMGHEVFFVDAAWAPSAPYHTVMRQARARRAIEAHPCQSISIPRYKLGSMNRPIN